MDDSEVSIVKVIMRAEDIPLESRVTKRTGTKPYTLRDKLRIFGDKPQVISCADGARFMVAENGDVNVVNGSTELVWLADSDDLVRFLTEETPQ